MDVEEREHQLDLHRKLVEAAHRLKSMKPRVAFAVPNTLTGDGNLMCDITFEKMDDFSPAAIAQKVEPLRKLLETRTQLANLLTYMDGKSGAEELIAKLLNDPSTLRSLVSTPNPAAAQAPTPPSSPAPSSPAPSSPAPPTPTSPSGGEGGGGSDDLDSLLNDL